MKYLLLSLFLLTAATACDDDAASCAHTIQGDQITLADGTLARLVIVSDERCPCGAICGEAGYIGMTITIGSDTILGSSDASRGLFNSDSVFIRDQYLTSRGDRITLLSYTEPENSCEGEVAGVDFCLELRIE